MNTHRYTRSTAPQDRLDYAHWHPISLEPYPPEERKRLQLLTRAIKAYIDGEQFDKGLLQEGIYRETLCRKFNRCIALDGAGQLLGWRGLCRGLRVRPPVRRRALVACGHDGRFGLTGALTALFQGRPQLKQAFDHYLLSSAKRRSGYAAHLDPSAAHRMFLQLCRDDGVLEVQWPFTTVQRGKESIRRYVTRFLELRYDDIVATQYGQRAHARSHTGTGYSSRLLATRPYDVVEIDEHRCQFMGSIGIPSPHGVTWLEIERIHIIAVLERYYGLVIGCKLVCGRTPNANDLLDALAMTTSGWPHSTGMGLAEAATREGPVRYPGDLGEPFSRCGFNQLLLDNALIHLAAEVSGRVRDLTGADINYGPVYRFERRAAVENLFSDLERHGFRRLPSTVGTSPMDPRRQSPERAAVKAKLTVLELQALIEDIIADHNHRVSKSAFGSSAFSRLDDACRGTDGKGIIFPQLPPPMEGMPGLAVGVVRITIRGSQQTGRRPYFTFKEEAYTGPRLARDWSLLGKELVAHVNRDNIRQMPLFTMTGVFVDTATVVGRWRQSDHALDTRQAINAAIRDGRLKLTYTDDPVQRFLDRVNERLHADGRKQKMAQSDIGILATELLARGRTRGPDQPPAPPADGPDDGDPLMTSETEPPKQPDAPPHEDDSYLDYPGLIAFDGRQP